MYTIATLQDLRRHLQLAPTDRSTDADLLRSLQEASHYLESATQRRYCPRLATLEAAIDPSAPDQLILPDDLLELRSIHCNGSAIDLSRVRRIPQDADMPASILQLDGAPGAACSIRGLWGWHDRWTSAWRDSGDALASAIDASAVSVTVADADALFGGYPRFQVGQLLRIGDEYLRVTVIDSASNALTVLRGAQGTTASAHASGAKIDIYQPPPAIVDMVVRYAESLLRPGRLDAAPNPQLERLRRMTL